MMQRCTNPKHDSYPDYGGSGITVCERWQSFSGFLADMGIRSTGRTLDRIDGTKGYEPGNCRWATPAQQSRNSRRTDLNVVAVCLIRHMRLRGAKCADIAHAFGVTKGQVSKIAKRQRWNEPFDSAFDLAAGTSRA